MQPRIINMFSFQSLKLVPLSMGMLFVLVDIVAIDIIVARENKSNKQACSYHKPNKQALSSNNLIISQDT